MAKAATNLSENKPESKAGRPRRKTRGSARMTATTPAVPPKKTGRAFNRPPMDKSMGKPKVGETSREKFLRLATYRMQHVLYAIRLLGNLSMPNYKYEPNDIAKMRGVIEDATNTAFKRFNHVEPKAFNFSFQEQERAS